MIRRDPRDLLGNQLMSRPWAMYAKLNTATNYNGFSDIATGYSAKYV